MISYDPLWKTMEEKKVSSYMLIEKFGFYKATIQRLRKKLGWKNEIRTVFRVGYVLERGE